MVKEANRLLHAIRAFNAAVEGDSGDAELDAATEMKNAAVSLVQAVAVSHDELADIELELLKEVC